MPHFGLIKENLSEEDVLLQRSRLHIRCGKRRLYEGKIDSGVATLYDALDAALKWYIKMNKQGYVQKNSINVDGSYTDELFELLDRIDNLFDVSVTKFFRDFSTTVNLALEEKEFCIDIENFLEGYDYLLTNLNIMPFNEDELPPEDSTTF